MRKVTLLYNARSGGRRNQRENDLQDVLKILTEAGVEVRLVRTQSNLDAAEQARKAILEGCDTVFACGGDGTVHDVLQAMAGSRVALGVIPMGTANALAHDLGIPLEPHRAVRAVLEGEARRVAVGQVTVRGFNGNPVTRFFTVAVGVGVDAHLFYQMHAGTKQRLGMAAYYAKAWHLWFTHRMERFSVEWDGAAARSQDGVTELLAVRIRNFGGVLQELAPGASLDRDHVRLVVCRTASRASYLLYVIRSLLRGRWNVPGVDLADGKTVRCDYVRGTTVTEDRSKVYVEADGELIGTLPAQITVVPDSLTLLAPKR
ncbi:MAG TPA: YegS/Rv2252/BmrU family lipid kinase [Terriglobales bacterium]|nr:YegS/Rv2252/BmrU family lipid kinase [Terriglobales bacterium]